MHGSSREFMDIHRPRMHMRVLGRIRVNVSFDVVSLFCIL